MKLHIIAALAVVVLASAVSAQCDDILTFTYSPISYTAAPGDLFTVSGSFTYGGTDTITFFSSALSEGCPCILGVVDTWLGPTTITPGDTYSGPLAQLNVDPTAAIGTTSVFDALLPNFTGFTTGFQIGSTNTFTVTAAAPAPEPGTVTLMLSGMLCLGLLGAMKRLL